MKRVFVLICTVLLLVGTFGITAFAQNTTETNYTYHDGKMVASTPSHILNGVIDSNSLGDGMRFGGIGDVAVSGDDICLLDTEGAALFVFSKDSLTLKSVVKTVYGTDGTAIDFVGPEGIFIRDDLIYIADTAAKRIVVLNRSALDLAYVINEPENYPDDADFEPSKIAVSSSGKIYFTVSGTTEGIVELGSDRKFSRYTGANTPEYDLIDYFWKNFATEEQLAKMYKTYAPGFSNINIDSDDLVYAVSYDDTSEDKVFRFNAKGENIICSPEGQKITGDDSDYFLNTEGGSEFVDIAVSDFGVYAVLDRKAGRVFIYNYNGYLLSVFSSLGDNYGQLKNPSGIEWCGTDLIITDRNPARAYVYTVTEFGRFMFDAERQYYNGQWSEATENYEKALALNANYYVAYTGIGNSRLMEGEYKQAMEYFKISDNKEGYSKAYNLYRGQMIEKYFYIIAILVVAVIVLIVYSEIRYFKKASRKGANK